MGIVDKTREEILAARKPRVPKDEKVTLFGVPNTEVDYHTDGDWCWDGPAYWAWLLTNEHNEHRVVMYIHDADTDHDQPSEWFMVEGIQTGETNWPWVAHKVDDVHDAITGVEVENMPLTWRPVSFPDMKAEIADFIHGAPPELYFDNRLDAWLGS